MKSWHAWHPQQGLLRIELALRRSHPATLTLLALAAFAALLWLLVLPAEQARGSHVQAQAAQARLQLRQQAQTPPLDDTPQEQQHLDAFWATLGDARRPEQQVRSLFALARDVELELLQGQYKMNCDEAQTLCQYRIQLPVHGSYGAVRTFMTQVLRAIPFAALDDVKLQRDAVTDDAITAQLSLTLYLRGHPRRGAGAAP